MAFESGQATKAYNWFYVLKSTYFYSYIALNFIDGSFISEDLYGRNLERFLKWKMSNEGTYKGKEKHF